VFSSLHKVLVSLFFDLIELSRETSLPEFGLLTSAVDEMGGAELD
jgi:hypothetical protein